MDTSLYKRFYDIEMKHWWFVARRKIILSMLERYKIKENNKILDVGCGAGYMLVFLQRYGEVVGMDISETAKNFSEQVSGKVVILGELGSGIPHALGDFDLILAADVIEHIEDDNMAVKEIFDILEPGGGAS